jgi:kumamolisin
MTTTNKNLDDIILVSLYINRDTHDNGMDIHQYAEAIGDGTQPILDHDEFEYQFGATAQDIDIVTSWATANNLVIVEASQGGAFIKVQGTTVQFNALFGITLQTVTNDDKVYFTHTGNITIPAEISNAVTSVFGLDNSLSFKFDAHQDPSLEQSSSSSPYPNELSQGYVFPADPATTAAEQGKGACVAILELGGGWTTQNLTSTFSQISFAAPTVYNVSVDGGANDGGADANASGEVMLDIWCVGAVAPQAIQVTYFAPNTFQGFIDTITAVAIDTTYNPSVLSISWGTTDTNWTSGQRASFETALASCVAKGITVIVAAGDYGVKAVSGGTDYTVQYPASSPYVICAGGTVVTLNSSYAITAETPWGTSGGTFAGGGGVSSLFSVPSWQTGFSSKTYPGGTVATLTGRGIPDVSAMATGYSFYYTSSNTFGSGFVGTSAVAPLLAGLVARINQLSGNRIGLANATWYANRTTAFNDITSGDNHGGNTVGYQATTGWDAATGIGSPNGPALYKLYRTGPTYPKQNYAFRAKNNSSAPAYPRTTTGISGRTSTKLY